MTPRRAVVFLILALVLPFIVMATCFVVVVSRHPGITLPGWYAYVAFFYILGSVILVTIVRRRTAHRTPQEEAERARRRARVLLIYLIVLGIGCFFYGAYKTLKGEFPLAGAVRGGAILLAFIVLFSWALYKDFKRTGR
jgi:protein-S-isoprenylcysteine O-methyltransferase Ste14